MSSRLVTVLQTAAFPFRHGCKFWRCQRESNPRFYRDRVVSVPLDHGTALSEAHIVLQTQTWWT